MNILVTGGAGFIGSNFVRWMLGPGLKLHGHHKLVVLDALTYAGNLKNIAEFDGNEAFEFVRGSICDQELIADLLKAQKIDAVVNFAAETHVDRSIVSPLDFVRTNVEGTQVLLHEARETGLKNFVQISTDEVYGSVGPEGRFTESTPLAPSSAYSASKAGADLLALAAFRTHQQPVCVTRCSNNYGPYQFPEKLIPLFITNALNEQPLPLYGDGKNIRSWLHVDDHSRAIAMVLFSGRAGEVYNIGGAPESEKENISVTMEILEILGKPKNLIRFVEDRKGHDRHYAVDYSKITTELGWEPEVKFAKGLRDAIQWYQDHSVWWREIKSGQYLNFYESYYGTRLKQGMSLS